MWNLWFSLFEQTQALGGKKGGLSGLQLTFTVIMFYRRVSKKHLQIENIKNHNFTGPLMQVWNGIYTLDGET
jgi:hypothetical protein